MPVVGRLDQYASMLVTEFDEINYSTIAVGQSSFTTPGTYSWTVPTDVTSINVVTVGGGAGGGYSRGTGSGGGGGLAYVNFISVTPGETLTVGVGTGGKGQNFSGIGSTATNGANSYLKRGITSLVESGGGIIGGSSLAGGDVIVGTGGKGGGGNLDSGGGVQPAGGGGAGGYSGPGGRGAQFAGNGFSGQGGGGAGGQYDIGGPFGGGGGGVGLLGEGASGITQGQGGSGGSNRDGVNGGLYGGGGGGIDNTSAIAGNGASGAVRIIWGLGNNRQFPATRTENLTETYAKASISGLGTYYSSEFKENVGVAVTLTANVFAPYQIVDDEFAGVSYGPGQGTFMRQEFTGNVVVYNEIDEVSDFRDIVRSGLVLDLDAGMNASYNGSGTTWTDLSGNGNNGTLTNGPTYSSANGGSIVFDGTNDFINIPDSSLLTSTSALTINCWVRATAFSGAIIGKGTSDSNEEYCVLMLSSFLYFDVGGGGPYAQPSYTFNTNTWYNICCVHLRTAETSSLLCYVNGVSLNNSTINPTSTPNDNSLPVSIGSRFYNSINSPFNGNIAQVSIYNRALTAAEISQNFNALKHRFGL
jgi:hypothetical protein